MIDKIQKKYWGRKIMKDKGEGRDFDILEKYTPLAS